RVSAGSWRPEIFTQTDPRTRHARAHRRAARRARRPRRDETLGRSAAAARARTGARHGACAAAARRAVVEPGRQASRADALRAETPAARAEDHDGVCDARSK